MNDGRSSGRGAGYGPTIDGGPVLPRTASKSLKPEEAPQPPNRSSRGRRQFVAVLHVPMTLAGVLLLGAAGLSHSLFGKRLIPVGTVYDPFVARGHDALNYACYQDARFLIAGTPSGITLAPEGGAHQSIGTPLIGLTQPGLTAFEPAFADELAIIMEWAFSYMQDDDGGAVYLRLSTNPLEQPGERSLGDRRQDILDGAYWLRPPGPNCEVVLAYQGVIAPEVIAAAGYLADARRDVGVLAVTSADRLHSEWTDALAHRAKGAMSIASPVERLLSDLPRHCALVTAIDGHPATLSWLGSVMGHRTIPLGVAGFGQTGTIGDLYRHYRIDRYAIAKTVESLSPGCHLKII